MSEINPVQNLAEKQKAAAESIPAVALDWSVGPLLNAQADLLAGAEATVNDWLHRRQEAVTDTQQLMARMQIGIDPATAFKAQQEWMSRSFKRLAADADAAHAATQLLLERAPSWFPRGWTWFANGGSGEDSVASQAAATRAAGRSLRMANNKPE